MKREHPRTSPSPSSNVHRAYTLRVLYHRKPSTYHVSHSAIQSNNHSINAPVLRSATVLDISTYSRNPCTGDLDDVYIAPYDASKSEVRCPASTTSGSDYTPKPKSSYRAPLQPGTIAGIVLGCIGGVTGLAVVVICMRKKAGKHAVSPIQSGVCDDAPPPYSRNPL